MTRERGVVASRLAQLHAGEGGTILIEGPAGIGKSRLLKDFVEQAELLGTTIITSSGEEIEQATAFYAWRPVLRQLFGGEGARPRESCSSSSPAIRGWTSAKAFSPRWSPLLSKTRT